jgi:hypothetical protein
LKINLIKIDIGFGTKAMNRNNDFLFRAVITENGSGYNSHCLDIDISSHGQTIEEAKLNLMKVFENEFKSTPTRISNKALATDKLPVYYNFIVDEFYFEHKINSFEGNSTESLTKKSDLKVNREFDSKFIFIKDSNEF